MVHTRSNAAKRQKVEECTSFMWFKIASYLPADGLLNLALTCRRFGITPLSDGDGDDILSLVEETARRIVQDIATEEQKNALPCYDEDNWLSKYNYLQSLRAPLTFDQLVGQIDYVEGNKSCVSNNDSPYFGATAISNNIMMAGKHYVSFEVLYNHGTDLFLGVMRPGQAMQSAYGAPLMPDFYNHFTQREGSRQYNNNVNCCMYNTYQGSCYLSAWDPNSVVSRQNWDGMERWVVEIGMLLDLDEGTLSLYKNGRRLGVMKRGLTGHYCWAVSLSVGNKATIKRGTVPAS